MSFGDVGEVVEVSSQSATTITATYVGATPAANDLNIAHHFTGAAVSDVDTLLYVEDLLLTNAVESDQGAIYSLLVGSASDDTVTCSSPAANEQMLIFVIIRGPFAAGPTDVSIQSGRTTADPATSGVTGATAQAREYMAAIMCARSPFNFSNDWQRLGTATPTTPMTEYAGNGVPTNAKRVEAAGQILTAVGTVGVQRANGGAIILMIGCVTYKAGAAPAAGFKKIGQLAEIS